MADMKKSTEDVLRDAAHALAEITNNASKELAVQLSEALEGIEQVAKASAALPPNTGDLLASAERAFVKEFEMDAARSSFYGTTMKFNCNNFDLTGNHGDVENLPKGKYRAVLLILPVKP